MAGNPVVDTTNQAGSPFWNVQASDFLGTALSALSTLSSANVAKALAQSQTSSQPVSTTDAVKQAWLGNTSVAGIAAIVGVGMLLFVGGAFLLKKVK